MYLVIMLAAKHGVVRDESENHDILKRKLMTNTMSAKDGGNESTYMIISK